MGVECYSAALSSMHRLHEAAKTDFYVMLHSIRFVKSNNITLITKIRGYLADTIHGETRQYNGKYAISFGPTAVSEGRDWSAQMYRPIWAFAVYLLCLYKCNPCTCTG